MHIPPQSAPKSFPQLQASVPEKSNPVAVSQTEQKNVSTQPQETLSVQNTAAPKALGEVALFKNESLSTLVDQAAQHLRHLEHPRARQQVLTQLGDQFRQVQSIGSGLHQYAHDYGELRAVQAHIEQEITSIRQGTQHRHPHPSAQDPKLLSAYHAILKELNAAMAYQQMKPLPNH